MSVEIACTNPGCNASYSVTDENLGKFGRCQKCGTRFPLVPGTRVEVPPQPSLTDAETLATRPESTGGFDLASESTGEFDLPSPFGRYEILGLLGRGGMGSVYLAYDPPLDRRVALKVPHREFARNPEVRARFLREARSAAKFHHRNFCPIFDIGEIDGIPYLTMLFIEGTTLGAKIERGQPWDQRRAAKVVRQLAVALAEAHRQGVIHRDLKPANVMIDAKGGLVIMDFGLARQFEGDDPSISVSGAVLGTPSYMPPEQAEGRTKEVGPRSDVYSLGVILYELLTSRRPFEGSLARVLTMILTTEPVAPSSHQAGVDARLEAICLKAMAKEIKARYRSMDEFAGSLQAWLDQLPEPAPDFAEAVVIPEPTSLRDEGSVPRFPIRGGLIAAAAFLLLGIIIYVATDKGQIKIEVNDPNVVVEVDREQVQIKGLGDPITLRTGEHSLTVKRGDMEVHTRKFRVLRGDNDALRIELEIPPPVEPVVVKVDPAPTKPVDNPKPVEPTPAPPVVAKTPPPPKPDDSLIVNTLGMKLKLIPAGEFDMGSDETDKDASDDEKVNGKKHRVRITKSFYLGTTEVTVGQFRQFVERAIYKTEAERDGKGGIGWDEQAAEFKQDPKYTWRSPGFPQTDDQPVVNVSWKDADAFCQWLSRQEGQTYRLPTEAEWEYACRADQAGRYSSGDDPETLATVGNVADGTAKEKYPAWTWAIAAKDGFAFTAPVGRFPPNGFGLFDMHGNVWEWCADWQDSDYYAKSPLADPLGPSSATGRVIRGGCWCSSPRFCRSAYRSWYAPGYRISFVGFRVARVRFGP